MIKVGGLDFVPDELGIVDDDQDFDTEITLPKPPAIIKDEVFLRVAAIAGWSDVRQWFNDAEGNTTYVGTRANSSKGSFIPRYDRSIDAIWSLYEEFELYPSIHRSTYDGCKRCDVSVFPHWSTSESIQAAIDANLCLTSTSIQSVTDANLAIALCKLLIAISEKIE